MRILVCVDGSKQSMKAVEEAVKIVGDCNVNEVSVIHVYEGNAFYPSYQGEEYPFTVEDIEKFKKIGEQNKEKSKGILLKAKEIFEKNNIKVNVIFKEGHPAQTIADVANEEGYDITVIGSRGLGGLKKIFLGSVSNAVLQEAKTNVLVVK